MTRDNVRLGNLLQTEYGTEIGYCRKTVVVLEGGDTVYKLGEALGQVTANGSYKRFDPSATDGSEVFAGVYIGSDDPLDQNNLTLKSGVAKQATIIFRGPAGIYAPLIRFKDSIVNLDRKIVLSELEAKGFKVIGTHQKYVNTQL